MRRSIRAFSGGTGLVLAMLIGATGASPALAAPRAVPLPVPAPREDVAFYAFLRDFKPEALKSGISARLYDRAIAGLSPNIRIRDLNENQPEFVRPIWDYLAGAVSDRRIMRGREVLAQNAAMFDTLEKRYGVPREILAAIWGLETAYGRNEGHYNLFQSLATLASAGPRQRYGRRQFLAALKIARDEHLDPQAMTGSWAGAVGHTQFVPTTFLSSAVDGDGDGKRDLWNSPMDALASTAAYLRRSGWRPGESWGEEVELPDDFAYGQADLDMRRSEDAWAKLGIRTADGQPLKGGNTPEAVFMPAGARGPAFLLRHNFDAILKYNNATSYALAIGVLSDRLKGEEGIVGSWPREETPLTHADVIALQKGLAALGFAAGKADGILGRHTRDALRAYQAAHDLPADGFATTHLLTRILNEGGRH